VEATPLGTKGQAKGDADPPLGAQGPSKDFFSFLKNIFFLIFFKNKKFN
jgi:hypothetical protein